MKRAKLVFRAKKVYPDGCIREMVLWQLPSETPDRPHGLKYRLYYGTPNGKCLVRYDNERGKGDHRHIAGSQEPYAFQDVQTLVADFQQDIDMMRGK
jgi:hypothetical protein